ncbi:hypothetical protein JKP88DRAFT_267017, partial [Tribonema minus]
MPLRTGTSQQPQSHDCASAELIFSVSNAQRYNHLDEPAGAHWWKAHTPLTFTPAKPIALRGSCRSTAITPRHASNGRRMAARVSVTITPNPMLSSCAPRCAVRLPLPQQAARRAAPSVVELALGGVDGGVSWGLQGSGGVTDYLLVLNNDAALELFQSRDQLCVAHCRTARGARPRRCEWGGQLGLQCSGGVTDYCFSCTTTQRWSCSWTSRAVSAWRGIQLQGAAGGKRRVAWLCTKAAPWCR